MKFITSVTENITEYNQLKNDLMKKPCVVEATGFSVIHKALLIHSLIKQKGVKAFVVASTESEAQTLANDLCTMGSKALVYPFKDFIFRDITGKSREYEHQRLNVLEKMLAGDYDVAIGCADACCQYTVPPSLLKQATINLLPEQEISLEEIVTALELLGYERSSQVEGHGQYSVRGGLIDLFMPDSDNPIRIEMFGDEIDTINYFDIETQRRTDYAPEVTLSPSAELLIGDREVLAEQIIHKANLLRGKNSAAAKSLLFSEAEQIKSAIKLNSIDKFIGCVYDKPATIFDYLGKNDLIFVSEQNTVKERLRAFNWQFEEDLKDYFAEGVLCRGFDKYALDIHEFYSFLQNRQTVLIENFAHGSSEFKLDDLISFTFKQLSLWGGSIKQLCEDLSYTAKGNAVVILAGTERSAKSVTADLNEQGFKAELASDLEKPQKDKIYVMPGCLSAGFEIPSEHFCLISHGYVAVAQKPRKRKEKENKNAQRLYDLSELIDGDYVVHSTHGIGVFRGVQKLEMNGVIKDYIKVEYAKGDMLYVPVTQLDLISKYIGPRENSTVKLHKLGGTEWQKAKTRVKTAVKDMAKELIRLYSERMRAPGFAFSPDNEWQRDFEYKFEYEETSDQLRCIDEIKGDMERSAPMDRLLCGDVGFGKTEVALRAAFKCVTDSKQCALLCPTTILAWQHYQTVCKRFEGYPVTVELLSRFRTPKQQQEIIKKLKRGQVDMVIGTHRLVQKDVEFRDLGLAIIDEEQRFGVAQKERFKENTKNVDVLTLSATPIPRTLNMAMSGIRDMSVLEEAPLDRHPVQTYVLPHDNAVINEAIRKELRRGGQTFYLFNQVENIENVAARISSQIPEARVGIGHGKMSEQELSEIWRQMLEQEIDVLVCTTIIETGVDLPNANTLIIENADHLGLSQLHQIRGRVGRSARRAYAYFTFTPNKILTEISEKRLQAIKEFTEFGSGFKIAMRDLELRGAGNILGGQQHGHMEDVGYDMYLKLLGEAVSEEKGEKVNSAELECLVDLQITAHIPESYIENLSQRLDIYRRISDIRTNTDAEDVIDELIDRFGADIPKSVTGLVDVALIRNAASQLGIYEIKELDGSLLMFIKNVKSEETAKIMGLLNRRAMLSAGKKPYISVKIQKGEEPLSLLKALFKQ